MVSEQEFSFSNSGAFGSIKARSLLIWGLASIPIAITAFFIVVVRYDLDARDPTVTSAATVAWFDGSILLWLAWQFARRRVNVVKLVGTVPKGYRWGPTIAILVPTVVFSLGSSQIVLYYLSKASPDTAQSLLDGDLFGEASRSASPGLYLFVLALSVIVAAPIVEELLFRGVLLHRWTVKWKLTTAIIASSAVFGLGHDLNFFGAAVFGLVMCLLYIQTGTLIVPVVCHMVNNGFVVAWGLIVTGVYSVTGGTPEPQTVEQLQSGIWLSVALVLVSVPWLIRFVYRRWPAIDDAPPYFAIPATTSSASRAPRDGEE